jgi:Putative peptidoglycan binding domain
VSGALALVACVAVGAPSAEARGPLAGKGMWIWYVSQSGGTAAEIARKAKNHGFRLVLIKSSDGGNAWSQFSPGLVRELHDRGMRVCAWQFVYGNYPQSEARRGVGAIEKGADCLVIDAESSYEGHYAAADRFMDVLRREKPSGTPIGFTSFPYVDYHLHLPYSVFLARGGATLNVPQVYWHTIGDSPAGSLAHTYRWNRPYHRPIYPLGQTYQNPPDDQLREFRRRAKGHGAKGVSWWSWQETSNQEWRVIGRHLDGPFPEGTRDYPLVAEGNRGDIVVLIQELLLAWGKKVGGVDGIFGNKTTRAVRRFQADHGITASGTVDNATWRALRERRPRRINWSGRGNPGFTKAAKLELKVPAALEVPSTPGRP